MDYSLKGKKAVVCGASSGIGFGAAIKLASEGSDVIIVSRSEENLSKAKKKIKDVTGHEAHSFADLDNMLTIDDPSLISGVNDLVRRTTLMNRVSKYLNHVSSVTLRKAMGSGPPTLLTSISALPNFAFM